MKRKIFKVVKRAEALENTFKPPIAMKWVDIDKTHGTGAPTVRPRWVARDFKRGEREGPRGLIQRHAPDRVDALHVSRQATCWSDGKARKTLYLDVVKKAHLNPRCNLDVYVE